MGRWTPMILMAGGLAILMGTLLGINFPLGGQETASNDSPDGKTSKVLPANINVNSSSPTRGSSNDTTPQSRDRVAQEGFSTPDDRGSSSSPSTSSGTRSTGTQSGSVSSSNTTNQGREPIRALW